MAANPDRVDLPRRLRAMVDYALLLTRRPNSVTSSQVAALRETGLSDAEIHRVAAVVAYFNFVNRIAEGLGVELEHD
ncbi:MAG: carboxymuconolactone decarboxylase family protein [Thermoanaerobaculia bacterium]